MMIKVERISLSTSMRMVVVIPNGPLKARLYTAFKAIIAV